MDGREFVQLIEAQLVQQGISKTKFYEDCGLSSAVFSNWRKNINAPSQKNINTICEYLNLELDKSNVYVPIQQSEEENDIRELIRERQDLRILLNSAKDMPVSSVYSLIAQLEKAKEESE